MGRTLLAGVIAGIALFAWGAVSHIVLGMDQKMIRNLPDEGAAVAVLSATIHDPGLYAFPGMPAVSRSGTKAEKDAADKLWMQAYETRPHGILIYTPPNGPLDFGRLMAIQLGTDIVVGVLAALLLAMAAPATFGKRFLLVALLGVLAWLAIVVPFWNWYGFPETFVVSQLIDALGGFSLAGLVLAAMMKARVREVAFRP